MYCVSARSAWKVVIQYSFVGVNCSRTQSLSQGERRVSLFFSTALLSHTLLQGSRHFSPAESPLSLAGCLLKRLTTLTGGPPSPGFARKLLTPRLPLLPSKRSA